MTDQNKQNSTSGHNSMIDLACKAHLLNISLSTNIRSHSFNRRLIKISVFQNQPLDCSSILFCAINEDNLSSGKKKEKRTKQKTVHCLIKNVSDLCGG